MGFHFRHLRASRPPKLEELAGLAYRPIRVPELVKMPASARARQRYGLQDTSTSITLLAHLMGDSIARPKDITQPLPFEHGFDHVTSRDRPVR